jgi:ribosomal protein S18 acetylase RimI-like enzyme
MRGLDEKSSARSGTGLQNAGVAQVQRAGLADLEVVRTLRLRALVDAPQAFGSTYEREVSFTRDVWAARLGMRSNAHFIAGNDLPVGMVAVVHDNEDSGVAWLVGMWVDPDARGSGVADELVAAAIEWASTEGFAAVRLHVTQGNERAKRLYVRHGFSRTGEKFGGDRAGAKEIEMRREIASG